MSAAGPGLKDAPSLTFFCELDAEHLQELFSDAAVVEDLRGLGAGVSLGILDLSDSRADVVRQLNRAGIGVTAWQLLPTEDGYWYNARNFAEAAARYDAFKIWTARHKLKWNGIGIDIEVDRAEIEGMFRKGWLASVSTFAGHLFDGRRLRVAERAYGTLIARMRSDGYFVEAYHIPILVDERKARASLIKRLFGLIDLRTDREVLMLYTSFLTRLRRETRHAVLWSYGPSAEAIGIGSTGGGVDTGGADQVPPLDWDAFTRDLKLARHWTEHLYVFSLEGSVRSGFLHQLRSALAEGSFSWAESIRLPVRSAKRVALFRGAMQALLWISARLWILPLPFALWWLAGG